MAKDQNFENDNQEFNISLEQTGELHFKANGKNGAGSTRMTIADDSGQVTFGGSGQFGQLQLRGPGNENTAFIGGVGSEVSAVLGGAAGQSGRMRLFDAAGRGIDDLNGVVGVMVLGNEGVDGDLLVLNSSGVTILNVDGDSNTLRMFGNGGMRAELQGSTGRLQLLGSTGLVTADLRGDAGILTLGGANATGGDLFLLDTSGSVTIRGDGEAGSIDCVSLNESSDARHKTAIRPISNALDKVLALQGVYFRRARATKDARNTPEVGLVGQDGEAICPEVVATNADGYKSVNYSRMSALLVEAVKEQQQLIREQSVNLALALTKIANLEDKLATPAGSPNM